MNRDQPVLDDVKNEILNAYQMNTGETDTVRSIERLEAHQWNLEAAVESYHEGNVPSRTVTSTTNNSSWLSPIYNLFGYFLPSLSSTDTSLDPKVACLKFLTDFERTHGNLHPAFLEGSYNDALIAAKSQFKFLVIYLHAGMHQDTDSFCKETLCTELVSEFLNEHFVSWAGSINMPEAFNLANRLSASTYPFLAVICNNSIGGLTILDRLEGATSSEDVISRLTTILETHEHILIAAKLDQEERETNRRIREEQDEAFMQSLAEDQEKERKAREEEERVKEEERKTQKMRETKEKKLKMIAMRVPKEPEPSEKETTHLVIRLTDGSRLQRRFYSTDSLQSVFDFVNSSHPDMLDIEYDLVTNFPRKSYSCSDLTLKEVGLFPQASLFVQEK